jgi:hypothetical protein
LHRPQAHGCGTIEGGPKRRKRHFCNLFSLPSGDERASLEEYFAVVGARLPNRGRAADSAERAPVINSAWLVMLVLFVWRCSHLIRWNTDVRRTIVIGFRERTICRAIGGISTPTNMSGKVAFLTSRRRWAVCKIAVSNASTTQQASCARRGRSRGLCASHARHSGGACGSLLQATIKAHGGPEQWNGVRSVTVSFNYYGRLTPTFKVIR